MTEMKKKKVVESNLTSREEAAYRQHMQANEPALSPILQMELFELYLRGSNCEEIARVNKGIRLGAIVRASIEGDWHGRRQLYVKGMLDGLKTRVTQAQGEAVGFLADYLAVAHKLYGDKFKKFMQTGNEDELGSLKPTSISQYKAVLELMLKATGQADQKTTIVKGEVKHQHEQAQVNVFNTPLTPEQAMEAVFALQGIQPEKEEDEDK